MANNRIYLKTKDGEKVFLAKWYPDLGWFTYDDTTKRLNDFFDENKTESNGASDDFTLEYDCEQG